MPDSAWSRLSRASIAAPYWTISIAVALLVGLAPGLGKLTVRTDGLALVPMQAPEIAADRAIREHFDVADQIVVVIASSDPRGVFNPATLRRIAELTERLARLPGIGPERIESLANEGSDRVHTGTLKFRPWLDPMPTTDAEIARLRRDLLDVGVYTGTLISSDPQTSAAAILIDVDRNLERGDLYRQIRDTVRLEEDTAHRVFVVGSPIAESQLGDHLIADLATLVPISGLVLALLFYLSFRRWALVLLPMTEVGASLIITFSIMGWCGVPIYLTVSVLPVILTMIGVTDDLHIFTHLIPKLRTMVDGPQPDVVADTMHEIAAPVSKASLTTAVGFLSFVTSSIVPVQIFGLFMAIGVLSCALWSLTVMPAALALIPARRLRRTSAAPPGSVLTAPSWRLEAFGSWVVRWHKPILASVALFLVAAPFGLLRVRVQDSWIDGFAEASEFRRATAEVDRLFGGTHLLRVVLDGEAVAASGEVRPGAIEDASVRIPGHIADPARLAYHELTLTPVEGAENRERLGISMAVRIVDAKLLGDDTRLELDLGRKAPLLRRLPSDAHMLTYAISGSGRLAQPAMLERVGHLERFLADRGQEGVGRVLGPYEHLTTMHYLLGARRDDARRIPTDPVQVTQLLQFYRVVRGERRLHQILDPTGREALTTVFLKHGNFVDTARLMNAIRDYERRELAPYGITVRFAGDVASSQAMIGAIVGTQISSVLLSLVGIAIVTCWLFRSFVWGLLCLIPAALGVLGIFAVMGWTDMPLGVATSMFAATVLCIGDDYAIHLLEAIRRRLPPSQHLEHALAEAVAATAPAILIDGLAIGAAFGVLCFSRVPPTARLGGLVAVSIIVCVVTTLGVLPGLVRLVAPRMLTLENRSK